MMETQLAAVNDYEGLQRAMRARAEALGISRATLDALAGTHDGHAGKMLADPPKKNMGITSLGLLLQALCIKLVVVQDDEQMKKLGERLVHRDERQVRLRNAVQSGTVILKFSRRYMQKLGRLSGAARNRLSKKKRKALTRAARRARWA